MVQRESPSDAFTTLHAGLFAGGGGGGGAGLDAGGSSSSSSSNHSALFEYFRYTDHEVWPVDEP